MDAAKISYRTLPAAGEHLCVQVYWPAGRTRALFKREDALLISTEGQERWPAVLAATNSGRLLLLPTDVSAGGKDHFARQH